MSAATLDQVSVQTRANLYFDGKCVSHTVLFADGTRKSVGVILPATLPAASSPAWLHFTTAAAERMELVAGHCRVRLSGAAGWTDYAGGQSFDVPGDSAFDIEALEPLHYVCHFG
ncbi:MAG: pyrimidine/purine nucleoside phosphorylase [Hydrocarboniphaga sp.]|uniref:pyrimidine/purine nucleoside phosphorylase n=1 Tax=Hydrocarboniphaga sp. TaxID=2033016 RepID=UPI0026114B49|nr:pyrimidine/purine nucleoside phosphorylase [Hydrocarboniphaga sp.]MDB5967807.1 pyrimidine/purine nucleoside phosphorylase [Hydrocarboniphaga sp.]